MGARILRRWAPEEEKPTKSKKVIQKSLAVSESQPRMSSQGILSAIHANASALTSIYKLYADGIGLSKNRIR